MVCSSWLDALLLDDAPPPPPPPPPEPCVPLVLVLPEVLEVLPVLDDAASAVELVDADAAVPDDALPSDA